MLAKFHTRGHQANSVLGVAFGSILITALCLLLDFEPIFDLATWPWLIATLGIVLLAVWRPSLATFLLAVLAGGLIANYRVCLELKDSRYLESFVGQTVEVSGVIAEDPEASSIGFALRLTNFSISDSLNTQISECKDGSYEMSEKCFGRTVYVQVAESAFDGESPRRSDTISLKGEWNAGFGTFVGSMYRPEVVSLQRDTSGPWLLNIRDSFSAAVREVVESPAADLGLGYLLGVKSSLPEDLQEVLQVVGLTHIVVASGANLSILVDFSRRWAGKISRTAAFVSAAALVVAFVFMVGWSAAMVRAGLVSLLSLVAWYCGREFIAWRLLVLVAAITLIYSPVYILDVGWQLSFAAFAGILVLGPKLTSYFYGLTEKRYFQNRNQHLEQEEKKPNFLAATLIESLTASLLCLPILVYTFGQFSLISLAANLLILPTIAYAMGLTFLTGIASLIGLPILTGILAQATQALLNFQIAVIEFLGEQEIFLVTVDSGVAGVFWFYAPILLVGIVIAAWKWWQRRRRLRLMYAELAEKANPSP